MKIVVEEEYGWKYWLWEVNSKTPKSLKKYYESIVKVDNFFCTGSPSDHFIGDWKELEWEEYKNIIDSGNFDGYAHIHEDHDSDIRFGESFLKDEE